MIEMDEMVRLVRVFCSQLELDCLRRSDPGSLKYQDANADFLPEV